MIIPKYSKLSVVCMRKCSVGEDFFFVILNSLKAADFDDFIL